ncbi:MAG: hypothetical protein EOL89_06810 [Actinobacteria bacterium]|nr:hypothetical protein [Actinomycetota bacterium]
MPDDVRREVAARLYTRLDALRWEELSDRKKSVEYGKFVADPAVGGRLAPFLGADRIRVWIKDGPAKEYVRALEGVGSYVEYTRRAYTSHQDFIASVLGDGWVVREGSVEDKPMRCWVDSADKDSKFVIWGDFRGLKDLIWQAVLHRGEDVGSVPVVVIARREVAPLPKADRAYAETLCGIVGAECQESRRMVVINPEQG